MSGFVRDSARGGVRAQAGLTLIEVLVALAILALAVTPMVVMMRNGLGASRRVEALSRSLILAERTYEELKAQVQCPEPPYGYEPNYNQDATAFAAPDEVFKLRVTDDRAKKMRTMQITVWHDENGSNTVDEGEIPVVLDLRVADRS